MEILSTPELRILRAIAAHPDSGEAQSNANKDLPWEEGVIARGSVMRRDFVTIADDNGWIRATLTEKGKEALQAYDGTQLAS